MKPHDWPDDVPYPPDNPPARAKPEAPVAVVTSNKLLAISAVVLLLLMVAKDFLT